MAADGSLVARFTADLNQTLSDLLNTTAFDVNYAVGPLAPNGSLQAHNAGNTPYGE